MSKIAPRAAGPCVAALLLLLLAAASAQQLQPLGVDVSQLELFECPRPYGAFLQSIGLPQAPQAVCGYLARTEREDGTGRAIKLAIAVVPPSNAASDVPLVYLHGGPGGDVLKYVEEFEDFPLADDRVLILFDQRGWGHTTPHLCETLGLKFQEMLNRDLDTADARRIEAQAYQDCLAELQAQRFDLAEYGTEATVRDLEAIRKALGLEIWSVYGGSYGTTVALAYMSAHPDRLRAAILDATSPPERDDYRSIVANFVRADGRIIELCRADAACAKRFPDFDNALVEAIERLNREPVRTNGFPLISTQPVKLDGNTFLAGLHLLHYDSTSLGMIPLLIDAARRRKLEELRIVSAISSVSIEVVGAGANLVIGCREYQPTTDIDTPGPRALDVSPVLIEAMGFAVVEEFCREWPSRPAKRAVTPTRVAVPTLILGGRLDPITPPENGRFVAERLGANAQFVEFPYLAHGAVDIDPCPDEIARQFLAAPNMAVDTSCITQMKPPRFVTEVIPIWSRWNITLESLRKGATSIVGAVALIGLVAASTLFWPALWLLRALLDRLPNLATPFLQRSAVLVFAAIAALLAWLGALGWGVWTTALSQPAALIIGLPDYAWPGMWILVISAGLLGVALLALTRESWRHHVGVLGTAHRLIVVAALGGALMVLLSGQVLPLRLF